MTEEHELTLMSALEQADEDARRINLAFVNQVLADIATEEDAVE